MDRSSQSILDILLLPSLTTMGRNPVINSKEADTIYEIWKNGHHKEDDRFVPNDSTDPIAINSLLNKGYLLLSTDVTKKESSFRFTKKAKDVIKKIILHTENSIYDTSQSSKNNYEMILSMSDCNRVRKIAHNNNIHPSFDGWFRRLFVKWKLPSSPKINE